MATLVELQKRLKPKTIARPRVVADEVLMADTRGNISPASVVERKLRTALSIQTRPTASGTTVN
jgi:hypothetical protein